MFQSIFGGIQRRYGGIFGSFKASRVRYMGFEGVPRGSWRHFRKFQIIFRDPITISFGSSLKCPLILKVFLKLPDTTLA